jgi:hypothetical protein
MTLSNVLFSNFDTDVVAPFLDNPDVLNGSLTDTTATLTCTSTDTINGVIYVATRTSGPYGPGDADAIINGTGAIDFTNVAASATLEFPVGNMSADTTYYYGFVQDTNATP